MCDELFNDNFFVGIEDRGRDFVQHGHRPVGLHGRNNEIADTGRSGASGGSFRRIGRLQSKLRR